MSIDERSTASAPAQDTAPDAIAGLLIGAIGLVGLYASWPLDRGSTFRMGPGYLPALLSWLIIGGGLVLIALGIAKRRIRWPEMPLLPLAMVSLALAFFGLTIEAFGIVVAVAGLVVIAGLASRQRRWREIGLLALGLGVGCALLFVKLLGLVIKITPW